VTVRAAAPPTDKEQQKQKLSAMPRLPPRKSSSTPSRSRSKRTPPAPQPPEGEQPQPQSPQERALGGVLSYAGLLGTIATAVSYLSPDVDLFGGFNALQPADIGLALQLVLPCCLLNVAIMGPDYSSWRVPAEPTLEAQTQMAESLLAWTAKQKEAKAAAAAAAAAADSKEAGAEKGDAAAVSSKSSSSEGTAATTAAAAASSLPAGPPPRFLPPFGSSPSEQQLPPALARAKDALLMAQVCELTV
jgi:type IV secretory pathway VirB10-like protein